jgi:ComF family protein
MRVLLDLVLPPRCAGCGLEGELLCGPCGAPLRRRLAEPPGLPVGMPASLPAGLLQLEWCATYSGTVRDALHALKYRGQRRLREPLAEALADRWHVAGRGGDLVTWVPIHDSRRRERGFDQAEDLARAAAARLGLPVGGCLQRWQRTAAQHALAQVDRARNTAGVFALPTGASELVAGRWVLIVDDIVTTGATLAACAAALLEGGAAAVSAVTVARDR